ncbi:MAG: LysM peptidoglycan-binding domain-containing protein [candidate division WOR-3 bacterium]
MIEEGVVSSLKEGSFSCVNNQNIVANLDKKEETSNNENNNSQNKKKEAIEYVVQPGDTLSTIAEKFGIKTQTVLWANNLDYLSVIQPGDKLTIPPEDGVLYTVKAGDTLLDIAVRYKADLDKIVAFNQLDANYIVEGQVLFIPDGIKPAPQPTTTYLASASSRASSYTSSYTPTIRYGSGGNRFPYGYCTWYVAQRRGGVPWSGNAGAWLANARAYGYATGSEPVPGAIMVTRESWWGHVAYVESVSGNMVTISEMNYQGYGIVSRRTLNKNDWRIRGYIY